MVLGEDAVLVFTGGHKYPGIENRPPPVKGKGAIMMVPV